MATDKKLLDGIDCKITVGSLYSFLQSNHRNTRSVLVTTSGFSRRGITAAVKQLLGTSLVQVIDDVEPNPSIQSIEKYRQKLAGCNINAMVAIGGGSVLDTAKIISTWLASPHSTVDSLLANSVDIDASQFILTAIPTTAGSGAELTPFATIWDTEKLKKHSVAVLRPNNIVIDSSLSCSLPYQETLYSGLDALSHGLESVWNKNLTADSLRCAMAAIELICDNLPIVLKTPKDLAARQNMLFASLLSGRAISTTKTALAHAISYPLTLRHNIPHGLACSVTLLAILNDIVGTDSPLEKATLNKVRSLLSGLNLSQEVEKYVSWQTLLDNYDYNLDPSRLRNFDFTVSNECIKKILVRSSGIQHRSISDD